MNNRLKLEQSILDIEWGMFHTVHNRGGAAACQNDHATFAIMRRSMYVLWDEATLRSYLDDLRRAKEERRNLMTEKYARMMERTFPEEYARVAAALPPVDPAAAAMVDEIVAINVAWKAEVDRAFPVLAALGRPLRSADDRPGLPSLETYMRAELRTFSPATIALLRAATLRRRGAGENEARIALLSQVREYGFSDLDEAEGYFAKSAAV